MSITVDDLSISNIKDCVMFCHGYDYSEWYEKEYNQIWEKQIKETVENRIHWAQNALKEIGSCAKLAYYEENLAGIVWFFPTYWIPYPDPAKNERVIFIQCLDVKNKYRKKGIGSALIQNLINSCRKSHHFFSGEKPEAIEVFVFPPAQYPAGSVDFLKKQGFEIKRKNIKEMYNSILLRLDL
jgi:GNAT superfamily N-acetyltransferase